MLGLYYAPGACSMAAHIALEESGETYEPIRMDLAKGEQRSDAYLKLNPLGRVPVLRLDDGTPLSENTAILPYLGKRFGLWPTDALGEAKLLSLIGYFAATVHPAFAHVGRPERYSDDPVRLSRAQGEGPQDLSRLPQGHRRPARRPRMARSTATRSSIPMPSSSMSGACVASCRSAELKNYTAFKDRLLQRPAVQRAIDDEQVKAMRSPRMRAHLGMISLFAVALPLVHGAAWGEAATTQTPAAQAPVTGTPAAQAPASQTPAAQQPAPSAYKPKASACDRHAFRPSSMSAIPPGWAGATSARGVYEYEFNLRLPSGREASSPMPDSTGRSS